MFTKLLTAVALSFFATCSSDAATGLCFSELMISPATGGEWIELSNAGPGEQPLIVTITDRSGQKIQVTDQGRISTGGFWVLGKDSATIAILNLPPFVHRTIPARWTSLNNDGDSLALFDSAGVQVDGVDYRAQELPARGHSLERINSAASGLDPANWGECADPLGNTAGRANSLHPANAESKPRIWAEPNPFSPDGDGHDDITRFHFSLPAATSHITLDLFTADGRPLLRLAHDLPAGASVPTILWDGKVNGDTCAVGRYVAVISASSARSGSTYTARCTVVLARRL